MADGDLNWAVMAEMETGAKQTSMWITFVPGRPATTQIATNIVPDLVDVARFPARDQAKQAAVWLGVLTGRPTEVEWIGDGWWY